MAEDFFELKREFRPDAFTWKDSQYGKELSDSVNLIKSGYRACEEEAQELVEAVSNFIDGEYPIVHSAACIANNNIFGKDCDCGVSKSLDNMVNQLAKWKERGV